MDSYSELASCYDIFMEDVPYDKWLEFVLDVFDDISILFSHLSFLDVILFLFLLLLLILLFFLIFKEIET